jgi:cbb3-type cytochrome oxidase maturation protein
MESIFLLLPLAMLFTALAAWLFIWAVNNNQYDDLDKHGQQLMFEDHDKPTGND